MAFVNQQFPPEISFDAKERVRHSTSVVQVNSGRTQRNKNWSFPLREFDVSHAARVKKYFDQLVAFNLAVAEGMANSFRYKAWADYQVLSTEGRFQTLTATTFQLLKRYTFGSAVIDRPITLPVAGRTTITGTGTYTFDSTTGIVTKLVADADPTSWSGEFDVRCYMGVDLAEYTIRDRSGASFIMGADQITLMEERA